MYNIFEAYSVEYYIGEKRSGKTLSMTADTKEDLTRIGKEIKLFTNYHLKKPFFKEMETKDYKMIEKIDLAKYYQNKNEFSNCIFLIDAFQTWLDARNFMKSVEIDGKKVNYNQAVSYFLGQMGKRGNILRATLHDYTLIDIRGRLYSDKLNYCFRGLIDDIQKWKPLLNLHRELNEDENERCRIQIISYIKKMVRTVFLPEFKYVKLEPRYIKAQDHYDCYDTQELI